MLDVRLIDPADAGLVVDALLLAASIADGARRDSYLRLADEFGDALDLLPRPTRVYAERFAADGAAEHATQHG